MHNRESIKPALRILLLILAVAPAWAETTTELRDEALIEALRNGGYNLYFRHTATDWSQQDHVRKVDDWLSCEPSRMRQLAEPGRATARAIGAAMRALRIPVGKVLASPYCRTVETARLMDLAPVETTTDVMNLRVAEYFGGREAIVATAQARLATATSPGTNTVIVAHGNVAREATPVYPDEGEGAVFQPDDQGGFRYVGRLSPSEWKRLAANHRGARRPQ